MNTTPAARSKARHYAMQALYQWYMAGADISVIEAEFHADNDMKKVDVEYFHEILHKIPAQVNDLDEIYAVNLQDRSLDELDPIARAVLRLATYELKARIDVPYKVVINEAVNLTKKFGATDSHKYVNAVLDKTAATLRAAEVSAR